MSPQTPKTLEKLEWDTSFFKKDVYRLYSTSPSDVKSLTQSLCRPSIIYLHSDLELSELRSELVDVKVCFEVPTSKIKASSRDTGTVFFDGQNMDLQQLERLAIISSSQSRFRNDPRIPSELTDELYRLWIRKAVQSPKSHRIVAKLIDQAVAGMFSLSQSTEMIKIELVAVDPKHQRKGIAGDLMTACLNYSLENNFRLVQVVTQLDNIGACQLYKKFGFEIVEKTFVYHLHVG